ncbi:hypothetical protein EHO25_22495 [Salmonella enterica subsp. enterica serovar Cerro]|nr:hypothetical protein [Salmonella enterica subsp. enterica serovar Cerro]
MFSLWVKWPEKAVSESSHELAQLSCLVQVERAASENLSLVQFYSHTAAKPDGNAGRSPS